MAEPSQTPLPDNHVEDGNDANAHAYFAGLVLDDHINSWDNTMQEIPSVPEHNNVNRDVPADVSDSGIEYPEIQPDFNNLNNGEDHRVIFDLDTQQTINVATDQETVNSPSNDVNSIPCITSEKRDGLQENFNMGQSNNFGKVYYVLPNVAQPLEKLASSRNFSIEDYYTPQQGISSAEHMLKSSGALGSSSSTMVCHAAMPDIPIAPAGTYSRCHNDQNEVLGTVAKSTQDLSTLKITTERLPSETGHTRALDQYPEGKSFSNLGNESMEVDQHNVHQRVANLQNQQGYVQRQGLVNRSPISPSGGKQYSNCRDRYHPYNSPCSAQNPVTLSQYEHCPYPVSHQRPSTSQASNSCSTTFPVHTFEAHEQSEQAFRADALTVDLQVPENPFPATQNFYRPYHGYYQSPNSSYAGSLDEPEGLDGREGDVVARSNRHVRMPSREINEMTDEQRTARRQARARANTQNFTNRNNDDYIDLERKLEICKYFNKGNGANAERARWIFFEEVVEIYGPSANPNIIMAVLEILDHLKKDVFINSKPKNKTIPELQSDAVETDMLRTTWKEAEKNAKLSHQPSPATKSRRKKQEKLTGLRVKLVDCIREIEAFINSKLFDPL